MSETPAIGDSPQNAHTVETLTLPVAGNFSFITVTRDRAADGRLTGNGTVDSTLLYKPSDSDAQRSAYQAFEELVLAHALADIDIRNGEYARSIREVINTVFKLLKD